MAFSKYKFFDPAKFKFAKIKKQKAFFMSKKAFADFVWKFARFPYGLSRKSPIQPLLYWFCLQIRGFFAEPEILNQTSIFKKNSGFAMVLLLPFMALMITGFMGLSALSAGIKNITKSQSYCLRANLKRQKKLGFILQKILNLNSQARALHTARQAVELSLKAAKAVGEPVSISILSKKLYIIKHSQRLLIKWQKTLLSKSSLIKRKSFYSLKIKFRKMGISQLSERAFYKKALAVQSKKIGDQAYIYKPVSDFINLQKSQFSWRMRPFYPLEENVKWILPHQKSYFSSHACIATLKKRENRWISTLYH